MNVQISERKGSTESFGPQSRSNGKLKSIVKALETWPLVSANPELEFQHFILSLGSSEQIDSTSLTDPVSQSGKRR